MSGKLTVHLEALATMSGAELREAWCKAYGVAAPTLSADLMRFGIAWRLQEKQLGGLGSDARRALKSPKAHDAETRTARKLTPGTRLVRDWHGAGHTVTVLEHGFDYDDQHWPSLTAIARNITGARWSGPRFFGLAGTSS